MGNLVRAGVGAFERLFDAALPELERHVEPGATSCLEPSQPRIGVLREREVSMAHIDSVEKVLEHVVVDRELG